MTSRQLSNQEIDNSSSRILSNNYNLDNKDLPRAIESRIIGTVAKVTKENSEHDKNCPCNKPKIDQQVNTSPNLKTPPPKIKDISNLAKAEILPNKINVVMVTDLVVNLKLTNKLTPPLI